MPDSPRSRDGPGDPGGADEHADPDDGDDGDWRFAVSDFDGDDDAEAERPPLEPGSPSAENVFFVLVGVALTLLLVLSVFVPLPLVA